MHCDICDGFVSDTEYKFASTYGEDGDYTKLRVCPQCETAYEVGRSAGRHEERVGYNYD
jgi:hypothetical protein